MAEPVQIDARGMRCPRPIIELAKARRNARPGDRILITADDLAFESDVKAWCDTTANRLVEIRTQGETTVAVVEII
ncbi:MAG: SirA family protein [Kiritimatiellaeota bacterium]|nr:SirA family protein [Kiritimatiellota bacterium]